MSKGTQFLRLAIPAFVLYVLAFFHVLPTPFLSTESTDAILPVVSDAPSDYNLSKQERYFCPPTIHDYKRIPTVRSRQLPWWLLVSFGAYSLSSLGLGLLRFNDCPEAYESLLSEISQAKTELRNQGVDVD